MAWSGSPGPLPSGPLRPHPEEERAAGRAPVNGVGCLGWLSRSGGGALPNRPSRSGAFSGHRREFVWKKWMLSLTTCKRLFVRVSDLILKPYKS